MLRGFFMPADAFMGGPGWDHGRRWGNPGWIRPPPPPNFGLCQGNFFGKLANGDAINMSIDGSGQYVTASVTGNDPGENYTAQGICFEQNGVAQLQLGQRFILQRQ